LMNDVDSLRQDLATGVMTGAAHYTDTASNPTGFPTPQIGGDPQKAATRKLVDAVWNTYGATAWCYAEFQDLQICRVAGAHALADDDTWKNWMAQLDKGDAPAEFGTRVHWIRGQDMTRTGYLLVLALITISMGLILLRLVIAGLVAVTGFLLMLIIGLVFLAGWPIPGWFRQTGTRYWVYTLGMEGQALFVTLVISGTTVTSAIIGTQTGRYGFFAVALLNLGLFLAALKARSWLEVLTSPGGAGSLGFAAVLLARSVVRTTVGAAAGAVRGGLGVAGSGGRGVGWLGSRMARGPGWGTQPGASTSRWGTRTVTRPRVAGLDPTGPVSARATRTQPPGPGTDLVRYRPPGRIGDGKEPYTAYPHQRTFVHDKDVGLKIVDTRPHQPRPRPVVDTDPLASNLTRAQEGLSRQARQRHPGRVWVDKRGQGLSPMDTGPTPARRRGGAYRITTAAKPPNR